MTQFFSFAATCSAAMGPLDSDCSRLGTQATRAVYFLCCALESCGFVVCCLRRKPVGCSARPIVGRALSSSAAAFMRLVADDLLGVAWLRLQKPTSPLPLFLHLERGAGAAQFYRLWRYDERRQTAHKSSWKQRYCFVWKNDMFGVEE